MTTLRHFDIAGACALHHRRRLQRTARRPERFARYRVISSVARVPRMGVVRAALASVLRFGRDVLLVFWAVAALGFCVVALAALVLH